MGHFRLKICHPKKASTYISLYWSSFLPLIAGAVHDGGDAPVEKSVLFLEGADVERAGGVVHAATLVGAAETAQVAEFVGRVALAAPFGARHPQHVHQVSLPPEEPSVRTRAAPADLRSTPQPKNTLALRVDRFWFLILGLHFRLCTVCKIEI